VQICAGFLRAIRKLGSPRPLYRLSYHEQGDEGGERGHFAEVAEEAESRMKIFKTSNEFTFPCGYISDGFGKCDYCSGKPTYSCEWGGGYEYEPPNLCIDCVEKSAKVLLAFVHKINDE